MKEGESKRQTERQGREGRERRERERDEERISS